MPTILYWMHRDQRARDNRALLHARELALRQGAGLAVGFCLVPRYLGADRRHYDFMLAGLRETAGDLERLGIPFFLGAGEPAREVPDLARRLGASAVVTDWSPLRPDRRWRREVAARLRRGGDGDRGVPLAVVDAHNVVPHDEASDRREWAARTLRPRLWRLLPRHLQEPPRPRRWHGTADGAWPGAWPRPDWEGAGRAVAAAARGPLALPFRPGTAAARRVLRRFLRRRLHRYADAAGDPNADALSDLSPYLHFGQIAPLRVALAVLAHRPDRGEPPVPAAARDAFLEQLLVRRELADNFCWQEPGYDSVAGFPRWARETLARHADDPRPHLYPEADLERGRTDDPLWNAAQAEMVLRGKMHGYLRMYWCKRILAWTPTPERALRVAVRLNDRWSLDGRDPNGYAGIAWSLGGVHDQAWAERPILGKVRAMTPAGMRRKFDVGRYVERMERLRREAGW